MHFALIGWHSLLFMVNASSFGAICAAIYDWIVPEFSYSERGIGLFIKQQPNHLESVWSVQIFSYTLKEVWVRGATQAKLGCPSVIRIYWEKINPHEQKLSETSISFTAEVVSRVQIFQLHNTHCFVVTSLRPQACCFPLNGFRVNGQSYDKRLPSDGLFCMNLFTRSSEIKKRTNQFGN